MIFKASINNGTSGLEIWIPALVSIITLAVNVFFYIFVQPKIAHIISAKDDLKKITFSFLTYLSEAASYKDFEGVPTEIRKYSLQIHLCFKSGTAPSPIDTQLEGLFQKARERKKISKEEDIEQWKKEFRNLVHDFRIEIAKYCGVLDDKSKKQKVLASND